jgi:alpha-L-rhamnosidase
MADDQGKDGRIPSVVPHCPTIHDEGGPAWADAAVIVPWTVYQCYGDRQSLAIAYPMMCKFLGYLQETCPQQIRPADGAKWKGYGDWLSPPGVDTPADLIGTAFWAYCAELVSKSAAVLGREEDAAKYAAVASAVREAWRTRFQGSGGALTVQTQTAHVLALHFDLLPEETRIAAAEALARDVRSRGNHLSTGFVGTPYLLDVLTRFGHLDVAYDLLFQRTYPGWLYPVTLGATTMWERWDGWTPEKGFNDAGMNSYNHYAFGAVGAWLYSTIAGIDTDPVKTGYKHIHFRPRPRAPLTYAKAALRSPHGTISSHWRLENEMLSLDLTVPANTTATLRLPTSDAAAVTESSRPVRNSEGVTPSPADGEFAVYELAAGTYAFRAPAPASARG